MNGDTAARAAVPDPVRTALDDFRRTFDVDVQLWTAPNGSGSRVRLYPEEGETPASVDGAITRTITPRDGPPLEL
jgi:hypothetical protein